MKKLDFYEFAALVAPGAVMIFGLSRIYPMSGLMVLEHEVTIGDFGLFLVLSYVAGHLLQALGDVLEKVGGSWPAAFLPTDLDQESASFWRRSKTMRFVITSPTCFTFIVRRT